MPIAHPYTIVCRDAGVLSPPRQGALGMMGGRAAELHQIVYLSKAAPGTGNDAAMSIARHSTAYNGSVGITGLLLFDGERFIQAVEGPEAEVNRLMDRIEQDPRHSAISYIAQGPTADRQFGTWSMDYKRAPDGCCSSDFLDRVKDGVAAVSDPQLQAAFIGFAVLAAKLPRGYVCHATAEIRA